MSKEDTLRWQQALDLIHENERRQVAAEEEERSANQAREELIKADAKSLGEFFQTQAGEIALNLLQATGVVVTIGVDNDGNSESQGYFLMSSADGSRRGFYREDVTGGGMSGFYSHKAPLISYTRISPADAVRAGVAFGAMQPGRVTETIIGKITAIANEVLPQNPPQA